MPGQIPPGESIRRYCQLAGGGGILCRHAHSLLTLMEEDVVITKGILRLALSII